MSLSSIWHRRRQAATTQLGVVHLVFEFEDGFAVKLCELLYEEAAPLMMEVEDCNLERMNPDEITCTNCIHRRADYKHLMDTEDAED
jgi:hypothetical protein